MIPSFPDQVRPSDTVIWRTDEALTPTLDPIRSTDSWALNTYVRFPVATGATQVTGTSYGSGWESTLSTAVTALFPTGQRGSWQSVATFGALAYTIASGSFDVLANLTTAGAVDARSQARRDLDACQAAIRAVIAGGGAQEYRIGARMVRRYELSELLRLEGQLKAEVAREEAAEAIASGRGNPFSLFVRFS
jgi:hypothetical protein